MLENSGAGDESSESRWKQNTTSKVDLNSALLESPTTETEDSEGNVEETENRFDIGRQIRRKIFKVNVSIVDQILRKTRNQKSFFIFR